MRKELTIRQKDVELFEYLYAVQFSLIEQIQRDIYPHLSQCAIYKRLRRLEKKRWIYGHFLSDKRKAYSIGGKAFNHYVSHKVRRRVKIYDDFLDYHIKLVDIRRLFKSSPYVVEYFTKREIESCKKEEFVPFQRTYADAGIKTLLPNGEFYFALEYESSPKSELRTWLNLQKYYSESQIAAVFYVVKSQKRLEKVVKLEKRLRVDRDIKIYYVLKENLNFHAPLKFTNCKEETLNLKNPKAA